MLNIGNVVKVLYPFTESFPDTYMITESTADSIGQVAYTLGDNGSFDEIYLELV